MLTPLPCPICGAPGYSRAHEEMERSFMAGCSDPECIAHLLAFDFVTEEAAVATWNKRANLTVPDRFIERLLGQAINVENDGWLNAARLMREAASALQASAAARLKAEGERDHFAEYKAAWEAKADEFATSAEAAELRASKAEEREKVLVEALTPSADTKAAYIGEFRFSVPRWDEDEDGEPVQTSYDITVPWDTTKQIMAAIRARAALHLKDEGWVKRLINRLNPRDGMISVSVPALELALSEAVPAPARPAPTTLIERLLARRTVVDDGPDGRGGYYTHEEPDALCQDAAEALNAAQRALDWYADPTSYALTQAAEPRSAVHGDAGQRARRALERFNPSKD